VFAAAAECIVEPFENVSPVVDSEALSEFVVLTRVLDTPRCHCPVCSESRPNTCPDDSVHPRSPIFGLGTEQFCDVRGRVVRGSFKVLFARTAVGRESSIVLSHDRLLRVPRRIPPTPQGGW